MTRFKKYMAVLLSVVILSVATGCGTKEGEGEPVKTTVQEIEQSGAVEEEQSSSQEEALTEENVAAGVKYGDTIRATYREADIFSEFSEKDRYSAEIEFVVDSATTEFPLEDYDIPEEIVKSVVEGVIGKNVDYNSFGLPYYSRDMYYIYSYTILEVQKGSTETQESSIEYGDTVCVLLKINEKPILWKDKGEVELVVDSSVWEFQIADYEYTEEQVMKNVDKVIGKQVGDVFTLHFEFGDGALRCEYTILEIKPSASGEAVF